MIDLHSDLLLYILEKWIVAKTHDLTQRRCQKMGFTPWLKSGQRQPVVNVVVVFVYTGNRVIGGELQRHMC